MEDTATDGKMTIGQLPRMGLDLARKKLGDIALRAVSGERTVLMVNGKDAAVVISMKDMERYLALEAASVAA